MPSVPRLPGDRAVVLTGLAAGASGVMAGSLRAPGPLALLALLVLAGLLGAVWHAGIRRSQAKRLCNDIDSGALVAQSAEQVTTTLLDVTRAVLSADAVLLTLDPADGPPAPAVARAAGSARAVRGDRGEEALVGLRWGSHDQPAQGVLRLRRAPGLPAFGRDDLRRLTLIARAGEARLRASASAARGSLLDAHRARDAALALGDLGAGTGPILLSLNALADRIDVVADGPDADPGLRRLAGELRQAERVVATLAGAVAVHGEGDRAAGALVSSCDETDPTAYLVREFGEDLLHQTWTTTGTAAAFAAEALPLLPRQRSATEDHAARRCAAGSGQR